MSRKTDAKLVEMVRELGDTAAYGQLVERYQGHAYGLAYSILGDWAEAQDIAQEAFVRAYVNLHTLDEPERFPAWLRRIVFSTCINWMQRHRPERYQSVGRPNGVDDLEDLPDTETATPIEHTLKNEMSKVVLSAIADLPQKYRIPLTMFHLDGLSYQKVADFLEIPIGTVRTLIHRAKKKLKPALEAYAMEVFPMVKEVLDEHKLTDEFVDRTMKKIEGAEHAYWGATSAQQNSVIAALAAGMKVMGEKADYAYLMGVGGAAFRLQFDWSVAAPYAHVGRNCIDPAMEALGYPVTWIQTRTRAQDGNRELPDGIGKARKAIVASIDKGRPAFLDIWETGLIVGYTDGAQDFLIRPYGTPESRPGYSPMVAYSGEKWAAEIGVIGPKGQPPPMKESLIKSLHAAVEMANTERHGEYAHGFVAYSTWIDQLRDDEKMAQMIDRDWEQTAHGNAFTYVCLLDARRAASAYLRQAAREFPADLAIHLFRASDDYAQIEQALWTGDPLVPFPWGLKKPENWTRKMRHDQADVLERIVAIEKQALARIEAALRIAV